MKEKQREFKLNLETDIKDYREFLYERENSESTIAKYITDIRTFQRYLGDEDLVDKRKILQYKNWLMEHYAVSSVNSMLVPLNQFLDFMGAGILRVKRLKIQKQLFAEKDKELSREEYQRLYHTAVNNGKSQLAMILETICATGIRISELQYFTVEKLQKGRIEVFNKRKYRVILIPDPLRKKLLYYVGRQQIQSGRIFITKNGKPKDRSNIWAEMKALHEEAGVAPDKIYPHNLRHLFARTYYQISKDLAGLADILGHSNLEVTRIYTSNTGVEYQKNIDRMNLIV